MTAGAIDRAVDRVARALPGWMSENPNGRTEEELRLAIARNLVKTLAADGVIVLHVDDLAELIQAGIEKRLRELDAAGELG